MNNENTGGPAFPRPASEAHQHGMIQAQEGMSLRDYFAAKALPPMLHANAGKWAGNYDAYAKMAYEFADAMLKAREA
jgi:hypothetical protein